MYSSESCSGEFLGAFTQATTAVFERNFPGFQLVLFLRTRPGAGRGWLARREVRGQQDGGGWQGKRPFPAVAPFQKFGRFVEHRNSPRLWEKVSVSSLDLEKLREKSESVRISWFFFISFMWCICRSSCRSARVTCWCQLIDLRRLKWTWTKKPRKAWRVHNGYLHNSLPLRNRAYLKGRWLTTLIPQ